MRFNLIKYCIKQNCIREDTLDKFLSEKNKNKISSKMLQSNHIKNRTSVCSTTYQNYLDSSNNSNNSNNSDNSNNLMCMNNNYNSIYHKNCYNLLNLDVDTNANNFGYYVRNYIKTSIINLGITFTNQQINQYSNEIIKLQKKYSDLPIYIILTKYCLALKKHEVDTTIIVFDEAQNGIIDIVNKRDYIKIINPNISELALTNILIDIINLQDLLLQTYNSTTVEGYIATYIYIVVQLQIETSEYITYFIINDTIGQIRGKKPNATNADIQKYLSDMVNIKKFSFIIFSEIVNTYLSNL